MELDHIAIAVRSVDAAAARLSTVLGYRPRTSKVTNTRQRVTVLFLSRAGSPDLKLIEPADEESPLREFLKRGEGLHHICFKVADVAAACDDLVGKGARVLAAPQPGEAFDDHLIAFLYLGLGLNVEVIDTETRRGLISDGDRGALPGHPASADEV